MGVVRSPRESHAAAVKKGKVFTTGTVAKLCKVAPRTVTKWFEAGKFPAVGSVRPYVLPASKDRRIPRECLIAFLTEHGLPLGELEEQEQTRVLLVGVDGDLAGHVRGEFAGEADVLFEAAASTWEAGGLFATWKPAVVVLDFAVCGEGAARGIAAAVAAAGCRSVIGLCGEDAAGRVGGLLAAGFADVLPRPFDRALLAERVRAAADAAG
jgi:hypothetical protein